MSQSPIQSADVSLPLEDDEVSLRYLTGGDGPPLLFLHGIGLDAANVSWRHALPALSEEFTVYAPDLPGHGESDDPRREYTTEYYVDAVDAFVDELGLDGAGIVGISMGGAVALGHALNGGNPEKMVLVNSYGLGSDAYWRQGFSVALRMPFAGDLMYGGLGSKFGVRTSLRSLSGAEPPADLVEDVHEAMSPAARRALRSWQRHEFRVDGMRTNYSDRLADLDVPTLCVHGRDDPLFPVSWSRRASETLEDGELTVFDACGHWPPRECPEKFNRAVRNFYSA